MPLKTIIEDLYTLGVRKGGVLLVHSSLRSLGTVEGGAETVIQSLFAALGPQGTLLLPALSYETVRSTNPFYDVQKTPSCVGALTEYYRLRGETLRSVHPTHSVCGTGSLTQDLLEGHDRDTTPCGVNSPFHKLPKYNGQVLFIGCGLRPNTSMHAIEELSEPPYLFSDFMEYNITHVDGHTSKMRVRRHGFHGWVQRYDRLSHVLAAPSLKSGKVLAADCHLVEAVDMWLAVHQKLQVDPLYFVDPEDEENR